jgi:hypothetical protein
MDSQEISQLLNDLESDRVERKASISDLKKIRQAICAFANDLPNNEQPGIILPSPINYYLPWRAFVLMAIFCLFLLWQCAKRSLTNVSW